MAHYKRIRKNAKKRAFLLSRVNYHPAPEQYLVLETLDQNGNHGIYDYHIDPYGFFNIGDETLVLLSYGVFELRKAIEVQIDYGCNYFGSCIYCQWEDEEMQDIYRKYPVQK